MSEPASRYAFRPVTRADFPLLADWLALPHVTRWWADPERGLKEIEEHLTSVSVEPFIILLDDEPIGYMQSYDPYKEADHPYQDQPVGTLGIDQFIGKPDLIGRGHGPRLIDAFTRQLFANGAPRVVIDPDPANAAAIRAYIKAGFHVVGPRVSIHGPALLMARDAHDQTSNP
jgi:aminoglycoside 6'-N-acetyltransferase